MPTKPSRTLRGNSKSLCYSGTMNYTYRVIVEPDEGGYHAFVPALPGCHTWGKTIDDAREMVRDAITAYVRSLIADGKSVPHDLGMELFETIPAQKVRGRSLAHA